VPWGVWFPDADGFRHPVVLYDGLKNLLIVPVLMYARRRGVPPGGLAARFIFLYAFPRIFIDLFREYPLSFLGLPSGQTMNIVLSAAGVALLVRNRRRPLAPPSTGAGGPEGDPPDSGLHWRRAAFAAVLLLALVIPSDATRNVPDQYGARHPGLQHSRLYPDIVPPTGGR
jgi:hypothetical protein